MEGRHIDVGGWAGGQCESYAEGNDLQSVGVAVRDARRSSEDQ